jgi:hypothetical protein
VLFDSIWFDLIWWGCVGLCWFGLVGWWLVDVYKQTHTRTHTTVHVHAHTHTQQTKHAHVHPTQPNKNNNKKQKKQAPVPIRALKVVKSNRFVLGQTVLSKQYIEVSKRASAWAHVFFGLVGYFFFGFSYVVVGFVVLGRGLISGICTYVAPYSHTHTHTHTHVQPPLQIYLHIKYTPTHTYTTTTTTTTAHT